MNLDEISAAVAAAPTIMDLDQERELVEALMTVPIAVASARFDTLATILRELSISHSDTYFEVDESNKAPFAGFAQWLGDLARVERGDRAEWLQDLAYQFQLDPKDVKY